MINSNLILYILSYQSVNVMTKLQAYKILRKKIKAWQHVAIALKDSGVLMVATVNDIHQYPTLTTLSSCHLQLYKSAKQQK